MATQPTVHNTQATNQRFRPANSGANTIRSTNPRNSQQQPTQNHRTIAIQWNSCGSSGRIAELQMLEREHKPITFALQETQTRSDPLSGPLKDYEWRFDRPPSGAATGGAALGIRKDAAYQFLDTPKNLGVQVVAARITAPIKATIASLYVPCKGRDTRGALESDLSVILKLLPEPVIICGDFNAHHALWGGSTDDIRGRELLNVIGDHHLMLLNDGSHTRFDPSTGTSSVLDLTLATERLEQSLSWETLEDCHGSDHVPIIIGDGSRIPRQTKRPRWVYEAANWDAFRREMEEPFEPTVESVTNKIITAAENHIPTTSDKVGTKRAPWWTAEVAAAVKARRKALRLLKKKQAGTPEHTAALKDFQEKRNVARKTIASAKADSWDRFLSGISPDLNTREIWRRVNSLRGKTKNSTTKLVIGSRLVEEEAEVAEAIADLFEEISAERSQPVVRKATPTPPLPTFLADTDAIYNRDLQLYELEWALRRSDGESTGPDRIGYPMLKNLPTSAKQTILNLFNNIFGSEIPTSWKEGIVIPIPKAGKDPRQLGNQRPICLLSCLGKLLERIVNRRLVAHLEAIGVFGTEQHGFRSGRGVDSYLTELEEEIRPVIEARGHCEVALLDLSKAYDTTSTAPILHSLDRWNVGGRMGRYIKSFLADRTFRVAVGNTRSSLHRQERGVPQGAVIAVTGFLIRMTEVRGYIPAEVKLKLYADDILLLSHGTRPGDVRKRIQRAVFAAETWAKCNGFRLSVEKSQLLHICRRNRHKAQPDVTTEDGTLTVVKSARVLGVTLDSRLNLYQHYKNTKEAASSRNKVLATLGGKTSGAARKTILSVKKATVDTKLFYGWNLANGGSSSAVKSLEPCYNAGIRAATGAFCTSPTAAIMAESGTLPFRYAAAEALVRKSTQQQARSNQANNLLTERGNREFQELTGLMLPKVATCTRTSGRAWFTPPPSIDWSIHNVVGAGDNPTKVAVAFNERAHHYRRHFRLYTDGSKLDDGDEVGCGVFGEDISLHFRLPDQCSVFSAEAYAICRALEVARPRTVIFTDSASVMTAVENGTSKHPWIIEIEARMEGSDTTLCWVPGHRGVFGNEEADRLANRGRADARPDIPVPACDIQRWSGDYLRRAWEADWLTNHRRTHLFRVKPTTAAWPDRGNRAEQRAISRLRIGHTRLTHGWRFKGEPSSCETCGTERTVEHLLIHCRKYEKERREADLADSLEDVLSQDRKEESKLVKFIRRTQLINEL